MPDDIILCVNKDELSHFTRKYWCVSADTRELTGTRVLIEMGTGNGLAGHYGQIVADGNCQRYGIGCRGNDNDGYPFR